MQLRLSWLLALWAAIVKFGALAICNIKLISFNITYFCISFSIVLILSLSLLFSNQGEPERTRCGVGRDGFV